MIFVIRTHHGRYIDEQVVSVPDSETDLNAFERVQSHSPYTSGFQFDPANDRHIVLAAGFSALRQGLDAVAEQGIYSPQQGWVEGHSWTWIIRPDLALVD